MKNLKIKIQILLSLIFIIGASQAIAFTACGTQELPEVSILINGVKPYPGDPISATPTIQITITTSNSVQSGNIIVDGTSAALTFVQGGNQFFSTYEVTSALADGIHGITIEAVDNYNNTSILEAYPLYVQTQKSATVQGMPLSYPNPFDPGTQKSTSIGYTLSKPANINLNIFDLSGNPIKKLSYSANQNGGRAGYNEVTWDGKSDGGSYVGNGVYLFAIIANGGALQNGRGKITVFKQ